MVRLTMLRSFCAVVEHGSFSRAAQQLGITQPAVSQQIRRLEDDYGTQLIHRKGGDAVLTEAGHAVYDYARQIVALHSKSKAAAQETRQTYADRLSIAASTGVGEDFLPHALVSFRERLPDVRVDMYIGDSAEILARLVREHLDLGFVGRIQRDRHLEFEHFWEDRLVLVVSPDHALAGRGRLTLDDFLSMPLVLQQPGSGASGALQRALDAHGIRLQDLAVVGEIGLQESTKSVVRTGTAATLISHLGALRDLQEGRLIELTVEGLDLKHDFHIAYSRDWPLSRTAQAFIDVARTSLAALGTSPL